MKLWIILYVVSRILGLTCPFTSPIGTVLGTLDLIARYVFIVLCFFFAPHWWYGILVIALGILTLIFTPKIDVNNCGKGMWVYSMIGSHISPIVTILMYLSLFGVIL